MKADTILGFDCLEFKWKVQSDIYEETRNLTVAEQIAFFRRAAETAPFAELVRAVRAARAERLGDGAEPSSAPR